ncbi:MAG: endonuclease [Bacteroidales bacterium]|nr:endonuclease [Bacteroidales bacterium]
MKPFLIIFIFIAGTGLNWVYPTRLLRPDTSCQNRANLDSLKITGQSVRIAFWNLENLYDPYDDTTKLDDEYTAMGAKHWSYGKFRIKLNHLAKTLLAIGKWEPPALIGFCEVENRYVLNKLIYDSPLKPWKYKFIHHESPDIRGIDVALLYRPAHFKPIFSKNILIRFPFDTLSQTREILMVKGVVFNRDTLTLFINHWPSRRGGALASQPRRNYVAAILRKTVDSLLQAETSHGIELSNILILGDFNDEPTDESVCQVLGAAYDSFPCRNRGLFNLMGPKLSREGSHKYQGNWALLDQIIISSSLLRGSNGLQTEPSKAHIFKPGFLLEEDARFFGDRPSRTYNGPKYLGGFSDHLPVYVDVLKCFAPCTHVIKCQ